MSRSTQASRVKICPKTFVGYGYLRVGPPYRKHYMTSASCHCAKRKRYQVTLLVFQQWPRFLMMIAAQDGNTQNMTYKKGSPND